MLNSYQVIHQQRIAELQQRLDPVVIRQREANLELVAKWERIQAILKRYPMQSYQPYPAELVVEVACAYFDCDVEGLRACREHRKYCRARAAIAAILRRQRFSFPEIGNVIGSSASTARNAYVRRKTEGENVIRILRYAVDTNNELLPASGVPAPAPTAQPGAETKQQEAA